MQKIQKVQKNIGAKETQVSRLPLSPASLFSEELLLSDFFGSFQRDLQCLKTAM